jgi:phospholipid/cholesterol/gamma-HCH transport system permease protein
MAPDPTTRIPRSLNYDTPPGLEVAAGSQGKIVRLSGQWTALALARDRATGKVVPRLRSLVGVEGMHWDLSRIERMDHVGGQALWRVWGHKLPPQLVELNDTQRDIFNRIALLDSVRESPEPVVKFDPFTRLGLMLFSFFEHLHGGLAMFGRLRARPDRAGARNPKRIPWTEISANVYSTRARRRCPSRRSWRS